MLLSIHAILFLVTDVAILSLYLFVGVTQWEFIQVLIILAQAMSGISAR